MSFARTSEVVFWLNAGAIFYVYIGYPVLVYLLGLIRSLPPQKNTIVPTVTIIITAYNEELHILEKLENTLRIDYPREKLQIIVASDCSNDTTDEIVSSFRDQGVMLVRQPVRHGKTSAQNLAVESAVGDILLFSDATTMYGSDVLQKLLPAFADSSVGCVTGSLVYVDSTDSNVGSGAKSYWNYESSLRRGESNVCSLVGASGCMYAVRRSAYKPMYPEACSDFLIASVVFRQGMRTVFEPDAVCTEETNREYKKELKMRVRVIAQTLFDLWKNKDLFNPVKFGFYSIALFSHKLLRYLLPFFFFGLFVSCAIASYYSVFYLGVLILQSLFFMAAFAGWILDRLNYKLGPFSLPFYFVMTHIASILGWYKFLRGERYSFWEPARENAS